MMSTRNVNYSRSIPAYARPVAYMPLTPVYCLPNGLIVCPTPPSYYRPSAMVEVQGTTYFLENNSECGITGSFKHKGTIYFPQPIERAPIPLPVVEQQEVNTIPGSYVKNGTTFFVSQEELKRSRMPPTPALTDSSSLPSSNPSSSEASPVTANLELPVKGAIDIDASAMEYIEGAVYMNRRRSIF